MNLIKLQNKTDALFTNSINSKTSDPHILLLNLSDKIDLEITVKYSTLYKKLCKNNKFKVSAPTSNDKFELPSGSYSVSDIQDYFECIKKEKTWTKN